MSINIAMEKHTIEKPYAINKMGTSGLRQLQQVYNQPLFLEQFSQGVAQYFIEKFDITADTFYTKTILLGGDPREGNYERIRTLAQVLIANGFKVQIAEQGLASTPAMSHGIRFLGAAAGVILTASHNPFTDVGIKINMSDGSPALEDTTSRIHELQNSINSYKLVDYKEAEAAGVIEYVDIIKMYADLLDNIFDFNDMKNKIKAKGIKGAFDGMFGAAGPFALEVFKNRLEIDATFIREEARQDLGGYDDKGEPLHPEPDFDYIPELMKLNATYEYTIVGAWDSDVDRRLDGGNNFFIESADEFALFSRYSDLINVDSLFDDTVYFCRSTVTADTIDKMESALSKQFPGKTVKAVQTPTGFKWIAELGNWGVEESNGVGNPYLREKDGIFATVFLLKIILETGKTVQELMEEVWQEFGRVYFTRGEVSGSEESEKAQLTEIFNNTKGSVSKQFGELILEAAESWNYIHPETGETAAKDAAWVLQFSDGNTVKARFSGTGSGGYTLRIYCSKFDKQYDIAKSTITQPMKDAFDAFLQANGFNGKSKKYTDANQPDVYK